MLKPEVSFGASVALIGLDIGIYQLNMPPRADILNTTPHSDSIDGGRKAFIWTAVSAAAALSLLAKDPNIFIFGGGFAVALDWYARHANAVSPQTGQVTMPPASGVASGVAAAAGG